MKLEVVRAERQQEVIRRLKRLVEMAEDGEIRSFAFAAGMEGRSTGDWYCVPEGESVADLVCAIERVKLRLLDSELEEDEG